MRWSPSSIGTINSLSLTCFREVNRQKHWAKVDALYERFVPSSPARSAERLRVGARVVLAGRQATLTPTVLATVILIAFGTIEAEQTLTLCSAYQPSYKKCVGRCQGPEDGLGLTFRWR